MQSTSWSSSNGVADLVMRKLAFRFLYLLPVKSLSGIDLRIAAVDDGDGPQMQDAGPSSDLCRATIDEHLGAGHKAAVVGGQKKRYGRRLLGLAEPA